MLATLNRSDKFMRTMYETCTRGLPSYVSEISQTGRDHTPPLSISNDMPESGGGGTSGEVAIAASDDDDGGDADGEPARRPSTPYKKDDLSVSQRISLTTKRRDGAVNKMTNHCSSDTRKGVDTGAALFNFETLSSYVTMGRSRIYALIHDSGFPPPIKIGKSSRWLKSEIDSWITEQAAARQAIQAGA